MALNNPWVGYVTRSYIDIKTELLSNLGITVPEITDHSSSNIMVVILDIFSGIAEMLNYYIDNMAREAFISTARRFSSIVKLTRVIDYRIKSSIPAKVDISIEFIDGNGDPLQVNAFTLMAGTIFSTDNDIEFMSLENIDVPQDATTMVVPASQQTQFINQLLGTTTADLNQVYNLNADYSHNSMDLKVGADVWLLKDTLGRSTPFDKHYIIELSIDKIPYIKFGDGVNGLIPSSGLEVRGDYHTTLGLEGNANVGTINSSTYDFTAHSIPTVNITNYLEAVAGSDVEGIEKIRRSAPLSLRTLDRAVTIQDYIDVTKLAPGIDKANIDYNCGKTIDIYVVPNGGGIAPQSLLNETEDFVNLRKMLTTFVNILPTGQSDIFIDMDIRARFRADIVQTEADIIQALTNEFSFENSDVNKPIRTSDIIALVDNLEKVDFLTVNQIYLIPYFRPTESSTPAIVKTMSINTGSVSRLSWEIKSDGSGNLTIFKEGSQIATISEGATYTTPDNIFTIKITANAYQAGNVWEFITYPYNNNIELDNFSIPIISSNGILLNITETLTL